MELKDAFFDKDWHDERILSDVQSEDEEDDDEEFNRN